MIDTIKRGKKNSDIREKVQKVWNKNLQQCLNKKGYSQEKFAKEYKKKYGTGSQSDVNRWLRVGESYGKTDEKIGLPSYEMQIYIEQSIDTYKAFMKTLVLF